MACDRCAACDLTPEYWFGVEMNSLTSWAISYDSYRKYGGAGCDDGAFAEGYADMITKQLARRWGDTEDLKKIIDQEPGFAKWVLRHIDAAADCADLKSLKTNAETQCPSELREFCVELADTAQATIVKLDPYCKR
jgi:hypothetical protein